MFLFAAPLWLGTLPVVAAAGAWGIWRGRNRPRTVSSLRLWQGGAGPASARPRILDPVWLLVFIAALLIATALARPTWGGHAPAVVPEAQVQWAVRSLDASAGPGESAGGDAGGGGGGAEAWVRLTNGTHLPDSMTLSIETNAGNIRHVYSLAQLKSGITVALSAGGRTEGAGEVGGAGRAVRAVRATLSLESQNAGGSALPLARQSFARSPVGPPFALLGSPGADPALQRVFSIQPGARPDDPTVGGTVLLLSDPAEAALAGIDGPALVIAQGGVPLPGLTLGALVSAGIPQIPTIPAQQESAFAMPDFVDLGHVHVAAYRAVTLSPEWHVLATIAHQPWIALRQENQLTMIWLASLPTPETDWPKDPSFVLFFAEMAHRALSSSPTTTSSPRWTDWYPLNDAAPTPSASTPPPILPLNPYIGAAAIALLITATALFALRTRNV